MKRVLIIVGAALGLAILTAGMAAVIAWKSYERFLEAPLVLPQDGIEWRLESGTSYRAMVADLAGRGVLEDGWRWRLLGYLDERPARLHAGLYRLTPELTPLSLLERLAEGDVLFRSFTIVEGRSWVELRRELVEAPGLAVTLNEVSDDELRERLGIEEASVEGWFLPETYRYEDGTTDLELLEMAHAAMREALAAVWEARGTGLPLATPYEILTLASIVEKETGVPEERNRIAGVFVRRLEKGMRLQTDPTVIYGLGAAFDGDLRRRDLRADTPWNTYTRHGLPPTPIAMPGRAALEAVVSPVEEDALFFVARGDGTHQFSATLAEHEAAVDRYQRGGGQ